MNINVMSSSLDYSRKLLLLLCIFLFSIKASAQTTLDSLLLVWQDDSQNDTTRLNALHTYIWEAPLFAHHDSFLHMHLITRNEKKMGHLDEMEIGEMKLYLPKK